MPDSSNTAGSRRKLILLLGLLIFSNVFGERTTIIKMMVMIVQSIQPPDKFGAEHWH